VKEDMGKSTSVTLISPTLWSKGSASGHNQQERGISERGPWFASIF